MRADRRRRSTPHSVTPPNTLQQSHTDRFRMRSVAAGSDDLGRKGLAGVSAHLVPDELWDLIAPLLPPRQGRRRRYRRLPVSDRVALAGIIYVLRRGLAWPGVPVQMVGCSGIHLSAPTAGLDRGRCLGSPAPKPADRAARCRRAEHGRLRSRRLPRPGSQWGRSRRAFTGRSWAARIQASRDRGPPGDTARGLSRHQATYRQAGCRSWLRPGEDPVGCRAHLCLASRSRRQQVIPEQPIRSGGTSAQNTPLRTTYTISASAVRSSTGLRPGNRRRRGGSAGISGAIRSHRSSGTRSLFTPEACQNKAVEEGASARHTR